VVIFIRQIALRHFLELMAKMTDCDYKQNDVELYSGLDLISILRVTSY